MFKQLVRMVLFCSIIMLIGCPSPTGNKDTTAPSLAATQDGIRDADTTFQIRFTEAVQKVSGQTLANGITVAVNGASPAAVSSASINSDTRYVDISFPAVKGGDKVVIVIKQGFLQDAAGNKNNQLTMPTITVGAASSDKTPPTLAPVQEDLVSGSRSYTLTFTEDLVMVVDFEKELAAGIKKVIGGTEYTATTAFIDPEDSTKIVIAFSNEFNQGESIIFKIDANLLKDSSDNRNEAIESSPVSVADKAPELEGLQAELIDGDTTYTIKFNEELTLAPGVTDLTAKIQIAVNSGTAENVATAAIDDTDQSLVTISWTTSVSTNDAVRITIAAGAFHDSNGKANPELSIDKTVAATADETPPALADAQKDIESGSSTSTVVFTEPVEAVEGANLEAGILLTAQNGSITIHARTVAIDSADRTRIIITFASAVNYPGQLLDLDIGAGLFQDASGNKNLAVKLFVEVNDSIPPALDPEQADLEAGSTSYSIKFSEGLSLVSGANLAAGIKVTINGTEEAVSSAAIDISEVDIILASAADLGDTVSLTVDAGLLEDYFGNQNAAISAALTVVDTTVPALASAQANLEAHSTEYTIEFTEPVELASTAYALAAGITLYIDNTATRPLAASIDDTDQKLVHLILGATAQLNQNVRLTMDSGLLKDTHNNRNGWMQIYSITVNDSTGPELQPVQAGLVAGTGTADATYTIAFNENLEAGDGVTDLASKIQISVNGGTSTSATTASINTTDLNLVDITFAAVTTGQTVDIAIEAGALKDASGNHNQALSVPTITVAGSADNAAPGLAPTQNDLTAGSPSYTITFDEPVALVGSNLAAGITFMIGGNPEAVKSALIDSQDPRLVKVLLTTAAFSGDTVSFTIAADKLKDAAGNQNIYLTSGDLTIVDGTGPALAPLQDHFEAGTTSYTIKFTEPLVPVGSEASLAAGIKVRINGASETAVQSAGINTDDTKNVDITLASPLSWTDTISFTMEAGLLKDAANNQNKAIQAMDIDVRDTIPPALADEQDVLVAGSDQYTIRFTEPVFEVDSSKTKAGIRFELSFAGAEKATRPVTNVIIDNDDRTQVHVTLSEAASVRPDGTTSTVRRNIGSGLFRDAAGNGSSSSSYKEITVADRTPPALAADQDDFVSGSTTYTLKFTEHVSEVSGATLADGVHFSDGQNTLNVSNADVNSDKTLVDITFESPVTSKDSLTFTMDAGVLEDSDGNGNAAIPSTSIEVVDTTGPALAGTSAELEAGTTSYTVTFDEEVFPAGTAKQLADGIKFTIEGTEKSSTAAVIDSVNPEVHITLASAAAVGNDVSLTIAAGLLKDSKGNLNEEITISSVSVSDTIGPKLQPVQAELVNGAEYTIAFNEDLVLGDGVALASEIQVGGTDAQTASIDSTDASLVKITFTAVTAGTVDITIAAGALKDGQDNHISALTLSGITVSASADETPPAPAAAQAGLEAGSTSYSIEFTEPVALVSTEAALAAGLKFTIGGSEEPVSAARVDADDPSIVHVTLASAATGDTASFTIDAGLLKDAAGNTNEATQQAIGLIIADTTGPALAGEQKELEARETKYRITFTEPVSLVSTEAALAAGITISIDGTDVEVTAASIDAADGKYVDITLASGASLGSNVNLSLSENLLKDAADNQNTAAPTIGITVADTSGPKLLPQQEDIAELDKSYILRFDENLKLKAGADLTAGILINVGTRLTDRGAKNPYVGWSDPTAVRIYLPNVIEGESVMISIAANLFTDANGNANEAQDFTKTIQAQAGVGRILASHFDGIKAMTVDKTNDDIYIAAGYTSSHTIQKIDKYGDKTTIIDSGLSEPAGLALYDNNLYVSDWGKILKFNLSDPANIPAATVVSGDGNGTGVSAPGALAIDNDGNTLYVIDGRAYIREINLTTEEVKTIAGGGTASQGKGSDTEFSSYGNLAIDKDDKYLYVADTSHNQIKKIDLTSADKTVTIVAGSGMRGNVNAYGTNAEFDEPYGICLDKTGDYLFVSSGNGNGLIRRITLSNSKVEYFAGELYTDYEFGVGEGSLSEILFGRPYHFAAGSGNFFYVGDDMRNDVRKLYLP